MSGVPTMSNGYTLAKATAIREADTRLIGVQLGLRCLDKNVSVTTVAAALNVTRQTIYAWFTGKWHPKGKRLEKIRLYLATLK